MNGRERERLILARMPQVRIIARQIKRRTPPNIELDDLTSEGALGLIEAVDHFEPGRNLQLQTFAEHRIRGAILDYLRRQEWGFNARRTAEARGRTVVDAPQILPIESARNVPASRESSPLAQMEKAERSRRLTSLIAGLPPTERAVLTLYCREEKLRTIAKVVHLTESRISQLKTQATVKLHEHALESSA